MKELQEEMGYATHDCSSYLYVCFYNGYKKKSALCTNHILNLTVNFYKICIVNSGCPVSIPPFSKAVIHSL